MSLPQPWTATWALEKEIDGGGQGEVAILQRIAAPSEKAILKRIVARWRDDSQAKERMKQEVQALELLHPLGARVPAVFDSLLRHENAEPFILMEYIHGMRFDKWLKSKNTVAAAEAVRVTLGIAEVIRMCHSRKIGHRDLKPANIILKDGDPTTPYVIDFGISFDSRQAMTLTQQGEIFWNEFIILPECQDQEGGDRDLRSDLTALAGIFFNCITGRPPVVLLDAQDRPPHKRSAQEIERAAKNAGQAEDLAWFFRKAFANNIGQRFQTMDDFSTALSRFSDEEKARIRPIRDTLARLNAAVNEVDRGVQRQHLRQKSDRLIFALSPEIGARLRSEGLESDTTGSGANILRKHTPVVANAEFLDAGSICYFRVGVPHYSLAAHAFIAPFASGMDLHFYVGRTTAGAGLLQFTRRFSWKLAVILETEDTTLSEQKVQALGDAVIEALSLELEALTSEVRNPRSKDPATPQGATKALPDFADEYTRSGVHQIIRFLSRSSNRVTEEQIPKGIGHGLSTANSLVDIAVSMNLAERTLFNGVRSVELTPLGTDYAQSNNLE